MAPHFGLVVTPPVPYIVRPFCAETATVGAGGGGNPSESGTPTFSLRGVYGSRLDFRHLSYVTLPDPTLACKNSPLIPALTIAKPWFEILDCGNMAEKCPPFISVWVFKCKEFCSDGDKRGFGWFPRKYVQVTTANCSYLSTTLFVLFQSLSGLEGAT